jgi:hypothetical protein
MINSPVVVVKVKEFNKVTNERKKIRDPHKDGRSGGGLRGSKGKASNAAKSETQKLLNGCTFLADIGDFTDGEVDTGFEVGGVEFNGALSIGDEDEQAEDEDDEMPSDDE